MIKIFIYDDILLFIVFSCLKWLVSLYFFVISSFKELFLKFGVIFVLLGFIVIG